MEKTVTFYDEAHLFVAAVRVLTYQKGVPPSVEEVASLVSHSVEWGRSIGKRLKELGIIHIAEAQYGAKVFIEDHLRLEASPREKRDTGLGAEVEAFKKRQEAFGKKIEGLQAEAEKRKKDLFAELERQLKDREAKP